MLDILLLILKIIGIILAVVLCLLLIIVAIVLFVPVRYQISARYHEKPVVDIKVTWLLKAVRCYIKYDEVFDMKAKALWFDLMKENNGYNDANGANRRSSAKKKHKSKVKQSVFDEQNDSGNPDGGNEPADIPNIPDTSDTSKNCDNHMDDNIKLDDNGYEFQGSQEYEEYNEQKRLIDSKQQKYNKINLLSRVKIKIKRIFCKIRDIVLKIYGIIRDILNKTVSTKNLVAEKIDYLKKMIDDPDNRELARFLVKQLKSVIKKIKPGKYNVHIEYGFDDPYTTGEVAMYAAVLYGILGLDIQIIPDFTQKKLEADIFMKGSIRLLGLIIIAVKIYTNDLFGRIILKR